MAHGVQEQNWQQNWSGLILIKLRQNIKSRSDPEHEGAKHKVGCEDVHGYLLCADGDRNLERKDQMDECSRPIRRSVECVNDLIEMSIRLSKATHTLKVLLLCRRG